MGCGASKSLKEEEELMRQNHDSVVMRLTESQLEEFQWFHPEIRHEYSSNRECPVPAPPPPSCGCI